MGDEGATDPKIHSKIIKLLSTIKNSKTADQRVHATKAIKNYVSTQAHEMSKERFNRFMGEVNRLIFELVHSSNVNEKLGGIMIIDELMGIDGEDNATKVTRANYLRIVLGGSDQAVMMMACKALGHLAQVGGTLTVDFVEFEVKRALEWLQGDRKEARRHTAILVLRELASNAPTLFYSFVPQFLDSIFPAVKDPKLQIRLDAVSAFRACLQVCAQRESRIRQTWYINMYDAAMRGLQMAKDDAIHGSLLVVGEMFRNTGEFMQPPRYQEACEAIFRFQNHRNVHIQHTVMPLMSTIANYKRDIFVPRYLQQCMTYLLQMLRRDRDRSSAFVSIGELAVVVGSSFVPYLKTVISDMRETFLARNKSKSGANNMHHQAVFMCISLLAKAMGPAMTSDISDLLDLMFSSGLTPQLTDALQNIADNIPDLLRPIQDRLLDMLSMVLSQAPYSDPSGSLSLGNIPSSFMGHGTNSATGSPASGAVTPEQILVIKRLALRTLGTFDFTGHNLMAFLRSTVVLYLEHENAALRKEAALTCPKLLIPAHDKIVMSGVSRSACGDGEVFMNGHPHYAPRVILPLEVTAAFSDVLEKLIIVSIADPNKDIRISVLSSLDPRFDRYLCQAENVRSLCKALNDEVFEIRVLAVKIAGRLTNLNPAYVMPPLRKCLVQLLSEIEFSGMSQNQEKGAKLLAQVIRHAPQLMRPYVSAILNALRPKLHDSSPGVASNVLAAIGELGEVGGESMRGDVEELLPLIIDTLQDQSSASKREVALRTLGKLASSTGYVMRPYLTHPILLYILYNFLKTEQQPSMRREVIKVIGIIGALDPYKYTMNETAIRGGAEVNLDHSRKVTQLNEPHINIGPSHENFYPTVAINALMRILNDSSLSVHHHMVIQAVLFIYKSLGLKGVPFLSRIMPPFLNVIRTGEPGFRKFLFQTLASLVGIVKEHIRSYLGDIFEVVIEFWNVDSIQITILPLVEAVSVALGSEFKVYLSQLIPQILKLFQTDDSDKRANTVKVLQTIEVFGTNLEDFLHLVIPPIVKLVEAQEVPIAVKSRAITTLGRLCRQLNFSDYASCVIHPLVRVLEDSATRGYDLCDDVMRTLCTLAYQLGADYAIFIPMVSKVLAKRHIQSARYETLVSALLLNQPMPTSNGFWAEDKVSDRKQNGEPDASKVENGTIMRLFVNQQNLKRAWEASQRSTKEDWSEWIRRLSVELLRESPSPALRSCSILAQSYYPLARELFNAAFVSCWSELYETSQDELVKSLIFAFQSSNIPPEITQILLNLAEFMEHDDKKLTIDPTALAEYAAKCHAYAKALHYKEIEFHNEPSTEVIEALIAINNQLKQPEAATGILVYAKKNDREMSIQESWYEKLQQWDQALEAYETRQKGDLSNLTVTLGRMRCLNAIGRWAELHALAQEKWLEADENTKSVIAPMAAAAAWGLGEWNHMAEYISVMNVDNADSTFFHAILSIHNNRFNVAQSYITKTRDLLDTELTALAGESYNRAYRVVVRVQMLSELEEIIQYKCTDSSPEGLRKQSLLRKMWTTRLKGCQRTVEVWQRILKVRLLVISRQQDVDIWLKFSSLCRKVGLMDLSQKTLLQLMNRSPDGQLDHALAMGLRLRLETQLPTISTNMPSQGNTHTPTALLSTTQIHELSTGLSALTLTRMSNSNYNSSLPLDITHLSANPRITFAYLKHLWDEATRAVSVGSEVGDADVLGLSRSTGYNSTSGGTGLSVGVGISREACVVMLCDFVTSLPKQDLADTMDVDERRKLLARCHLKVGQWTSQINETLSDGVISDVLRSYRMATQYDPEWYKAWHTWALMNFEAVSHYETTNFKAGLVDRELSDRSDLATNTSSENDDGDIIDREQGDNTAESEMGVVDYIECQEGDLGSPQSDDTRTPTHAHKSSYSPASTKRKPRLNQTGKKPPLTSTQKAQVEEKERLRQLITYHTSTAVSGFFRSISLSQQGNSLQDTLRLLTLWFKYGSYEKVGVAMNDGTRSVPIDTWLQVIPQLIARIHTPSAPVRHLIHELLTEIGKQHPQALIYPLTVASKSQSPLRKDAAEVITSKMRQHYPNLVDQTLLVSSELIRVAIVWHEMWHEGLEDASRLWFGEENFEGMYETLEPLHQMIKKGPETLREISFIQSYGHDLAQAHEWMQKYSRSRDERAMSKAWELYYHVFKRIAKQLPQLTSLELQYVSPMLLDAKDLELAVPGTYRSGEPVVRIRGFAPTLNVITSKQRPRKLIVLGSDGLTYNYLLKGHEDLRQDERVMQLFRLVNTLLVSDPETFKRHLNITRYSVIPLSPKSGLIGWVPHCDTLHALIKDYRDSRKILLNIEHRIMLQMAPDYDHLTVPQKAEVFNHALETTTGQDLYKVLWLKSPNSEAWLDRRTNYTRSLAVMSMVGYILGLGDRHPSNLMLDRFSGKILHIDFGDCFEVAMHREKFPEKVPFRLTRMLVNAMEVSGIEGNYRMTCNNTLRVLRDNRDSLMAVLEAFVYDPLINWRLMETGGGTKKKSKMAPADVLIDPSVDYSVTVYRVKNRDDDRVPLDIADAQPEVVSERAVQVINRVQAKLTGRDFKASETLSIEAQVQRLVTQATSQENLCQLYVGWCPFW